MSNMVINTNVLALNSHRAMKGVGQMQSKASQRLSTGLRINSAADDAAGLAISEKMRAQIRGLDQASKNAQDAISLIQTAEGGMQEVDNMIQRIRELTVQASNDTNEHNAVGTGDRQKIQDEINQLVAEIDSMSGRVEFNKKKLIDGSFESPESVQSNPFLLGQKASAQKALADATTALGLRTDEKDAAKTALNTAIQAKSDATQDYSDKLDAMTIASDNYYTSADYENLQIYDALQVELNRAKGERDGLVQAAIPHLVSTIDGKVATLVDSIQAVCGTGDPANLNAVMAMAALDADVEATMVKVAGFLAATGDGVDPYYTGGVDLTAPVTVIAIPGAPTKGELEALKAEYASGGLVRTSAGTDVVANAFLDAAVAQIDLALANIDLGNKDIEIAALTAEQTGLYALPADAVAARDNLAALKKIYDDAVIAKNAANVFLTIGAQDAIDSAQTVLNQRTQAFNEANQSVMDATKALASITSTLENTSGIELYFQVGSNAFQGLMMSIGSVSSDRLGIGDGKGNSTINVLKTTGADITGMLDVLDTALSYVTSERSKLGAAQNRLEYTIRSLDISSTNLSASESRIRDADMAKEMMELTKANVLQQAATSMLAQANQAPQNILQLLR